jgi:hypothetical protein
VASLRWWPNLCCSKIGFWPVSCVFCGRSRNSRACAHVIPQGLAYDCFT